MNAAPAVASRAAARPLIPPPGGAIDVAAWRADHPWVAMLAVVVIAVAVFWPTVHNGFLELGFDDALITDTEAIRGLGWSNLWAMATEWNHAHFVPLTMLSLAVDYRIWGLEPFGYHLTNIVLHALTAALVFVFLRSLLRAGPATAGAVLFAVHPVQMEAVSLAVQRKTVLAGLLFMLTLLAYQRWCARRRRRWYVAAVLAFAAAALAKPSVATLPLVLVLYDYACVDGRPRLWDKLPFGLIAAGVSLAAVAAHAAVGATHGPHGGSWLSHALAVSRATLEYVVATVLPLNLSPLYFYPKEQVYTLVNVVALVLIPSVCVYVAVYRRRYPWSFFCLWWFVLVLLPESNLVPLTPLRADRFLYVVMVGFALWAGVGMERLDAVVVHGWRRLGTRVVAPVVAVSFALLTHASAAVWHDDVSAWRRTAERHPWCAGAYGMLGRAYYWRQEYGRAEGMLLRSLQLSADFAEAQLYLGRIYALRGEYGRAAARAQRFLELAPGDPDGVELLAAVRDADRS